LKPIFTGYTDNAPKNHHAKNMNTEGNFGEDTTVLDLGLAYLASKGISRETAHKHGIQFSSVSHDLILERLGRVEEKWAGAIVIIWFPCFDADGELIGWMAEGVAGN
jgi:hypothetical protein